MTIRSRRQVGSRWGAARASYPLLRTRTNNLQSHATLEHKQLEDRMFYVTISDSTRRRSSISAVRAACARTVITTRGKTGDGGDGELRNRYTLSTIGVGARARFGRRSHVEIVGAHALGGNPGAGALGFNADGHSNDDRLWIVGSMSF